jgi:hypothetical protein
MEMREHSSEDIGLLHEKFGASQAHNFTSSFMDRNMLGSTTPSHRERLLPKDLQ